jgi:transglutaminase/protease-like cytokinesis protein 3
VARFFKQYTNIYFLTEPSLFIANHYPVEKHWTLVKEPLSRKDFLHAPLNGVGFIKNKINNYSPSDEVQRIKLSEKFQLTFTSNAEKIGDEALVEITQMKSKENTQQAVKLRRNKEGKYVLELIFSEKGSFYVEIFINSVDTFVYQVIVI